MGPNESQRLLRVEWDEEGQRVEIHATSLALERLAAELIALSKQQGPEHLHLMSEAWGGAALDGQASDGAVAVHHLKICKW